MDNEKYLNDLELLDSDLSSKSYINGYILSESDICLFNSLKISDCQSFSHIIRWHGHMQKLVNNGKIITSSKPTANMIVKKPNINIAKSANKENMSKEGVKGELKEQPLFINERLELWNKLKKEREQELSSKPRDAIKITLPNGTVKEATSWETRPLDIAQSISQSLAENSVVAKVNGVVWDLERPFECDSTLQLLTFKDDEGKSVFWHSTAHILGESIERIYGGHLCYGPPIEEGCYYDAFIENGSVSNLDYPAIEDLCKKIVKEKQPFERLEMKKTDLLKMFEYNRFKQRIINEKIKTESTTVYRCGPLIDLCRGPHVRHTGKIKALAVTKNSSAYWEGNKDAEVLQRVYGISFPDTKQLKEWKHFQEEAAKRDHRKIGIQQELFFFNELSPGSCFFLPKGAFIYNTLINFIKSEYNKRGFQEVVSPNIYNTKLWEQSGHWQHYAENMFSFEVEKEKYALKPMNCPGHCIIFGHRTRSWRELPLRLADFGVLHRNEYSGALTGLTRVRRFQQDDAHIFCAPEMIKDEINGALEFLSAVYDTFSFDFELRLATRPDSFMGDAELWDKAEKQLKESLDDFGKDYKINPGDGAFYGPKIDITVTDALRRHHQCATIQLDFQLPIRFNLLFTTDKGDQTRPVIIHRAILGSVERMVAILTENYGGKWPFWLSPRQAIVIPVAPPFDDYAKDVQKMLRAAHIEVESDTDPGDTLNKKIRNAQLQQFNFILVVGEKEKEKSTVNVRTRDNKIHGEHSVNDVMEKLCRFNLERVLNAEDSF